MNGLDKAARGCLKTFQAARMVAVLAGCWLCIPAAAAPRTATFDWTVAETLAAMGHPPVAVGDKRFYDKWVNYPPLSDRQTLETGLRFQPNLERLYQIRPDMFIQSSWFAASKPQLEKLAPVHEVDFTTATGMDYAQSLAATRAIGRIIGAPGAAEQLIAATEAELARHAQTLAPYRNRPLAIVQFSDARHLRIYGRNSGFQPVLDRLGLHNAWQGPTQNWGYATVNPADLAGLPENTLLIIVKPHPHNTRALLEKSALWQRLPFAKAENRRVIDTVWSYGGLPSMRLFARQLAAVLPEQREAAW